MSIRDLTEAQLTSEYSDNGIVIDSKKEATNLLRKKGFAFLDGEYRGKHGKIAKIYALRNANLSPTWPHKPMNYYSKGYLVSFGGEPRSCYNLKFTKIVKPQI